MMNQLVAARPGECLAHRASYCAAADESTMAKIAALSGGARSDFILCGEEYLYFVRGFIYPEVWKSWENGMKYFRRNPRIKKLWDDDLKTGAYYGLSFDQKNHDGTTS